MYIKVRFEFKVVAIKLIPYLLIRPLQLATEKCDVMLTVICLIKSHYNVPTII